jgi:NADH-quinone oxidoreductase subunit M
VLYDRYHTRDIAFYGGLAKVMPAFALAFMVFTMANAGLPGTSGFIGEFLTIFAAMWKNGWVAFITATAVIFSAAYALKLYRKIYFEEMDAQKFANAVDLKPREKVILYSLALVTIFLGFYTAPVFNLTERSAKSVIGNFERINIAYEVQNVNFGSD